METLRDLYLQEYITDLTHYRADFDLVIINKEDMVDNLVLNALVG